MILRGSISSKRIVFSGPKENLHGKLLNCFSGEMGIGKHSRERHHVDTFIFLDSHAVFCEHLTIWIG